MATILLIIIYITFIGLGIPDSLLGAAWPGISQELSLPVSWANFITIIISFGTIISSLLSTKLINKFSTSVVTAVSTTMTAISLFGFSISNNMIFLCLFSIPLGLGAGSIDTALNNYVAINYKASHMNFLHCFYGIGVSLSPFLMSIALSKNSWQKGYRIVSFIQFGIAALTILSIPLWTKISSNQDSGSANNSKNIGLLKLIKDKKVRMACFTFMGSCGLEYTCGTWGSTYLVNSKEMAIDTAALMITFYYVGIAIGRFISGLISIRYSSQQIIKIGLIFIFVAIILLFIPFSSNISGFAFFLIGMGNGPIFPNMLHLTPENFGEDNSQAVMGVQMAFSYFGIMLVPAFFGIMAQIFNTDFFPIYIAILFALMVSATIKLKKINSILFNQYGS